MKFITTLAAIAFLGAMTLGAADLKGKVKDGSCCDKAIKAGKSCEHPCCVEAAKEGKVCAKCNGEKKKKKE